MSDRDPAVRERVYKVLSQIMNYPVEKINDETAPVHIDSWDSISAMNLVLALEEDFDIEFSDEHLMTMMDTGLIVEAITQLEKDS